MGKFYKSKKVIIRRDNFNDAIVWRQFNSQKAILEIYRVNKDCSFRQHFDSEAEAEAELNRLYAVLNPRHDSTLVIVACAALAIAVVTYTFWIPQ